MFTSLTAIALLLNRSRYLTEKRDIQSRILKLKETLFALEHDREHVDRHCDKLSLLVAKKLCRQFADKFQAALPPELRDLVYGYVWDDAMQDLTFDDDTRYATTFVHPRVCRKFMGYVPPPLVPVTTSRNGNISMPWAMNCTEYPCRCFHWWELPV